MVIVYLLFDYYPNWYYNSKHTKQRVFYLLFYLNTFSDCLFSFSYAFNSLVSGKCDVNFFAIGKARHTT